jgi:hypothetical protein
MIRLMASFILLMRISPDIQFSSVLNHVNRTFYLIVDTSNACVDLLVRGCLDEVGV